MIAAQAARAAHLRAEERHNREEYKRSQLALAEQTGEEKPAEDPYVPVPQHYILVPLKDPDYGGDEGSVSTAYFHSRFPTFCLFSRRSSDFVAPGVLKSMKYVGRALRQWQFDSQTQFRHLYSTHV